MVWSAAWLVARCVHRQGACLATAELAGVCGTCAPGAAQVGSICVAPSGCGLVPPHLPRLPMSVHGCLRCLVAAELAGVCCLRALGVVPFVWWSRRYICSCFPPSPLLLLLGGWVLSRCLCVAQPNHCCLSELLHSNESTMSVPPCPCFRSPVLQLTAGQLSHAVLLSLQVEATAYSK